MLDIKSCIQAMNGIYVSNIPLLIYEGTLGELETYNYFKLHPMGTSYINTPQAL